MDLVGGESEKEEEEEMEEVEGRKWRGGGKEEMGEEEKGEVEEYTIMPAIRAEDRGIWSTRTLENGNCPS